jgi:hypothetical protein
MKLAVTLLVMLLVSRLEVPAGDGSVVTNSSPSNYLTVISASTNGINTNTVTTMKKRQTTNAPSNLPVPNGLKMQK